MAGRFEATVLVDRSAEAVFAFLADGTNDLKFSPRVLEITKTTDGPPGLGTIYASTVKDAGVKTKREFKLTEFDAPTRLRWSELTKNPVVVPEGGYDIEPLGEQARVTVFNVLEGRGAGILIAGFALRSARKGADAFAASIKAAIESS